MKKLFVFIIICLSISLVYSGGVKRYSFPSVLRLDDEFRGVYYELNHLNPQDIWLQETNKFCKDNDRDSYDYCPADDILQWYTGGTKRFEVTNTSASIEVPLLLSVQPCARGYLANDQDNLVNGAWTRVLLDAESFDVGNDFSIANSSFTVPITGYYQINAAIMFEAADMVADKGYYLVVKQNTTDLFSTHVHASVASVVLSCTVADIAYLTVGDEVSLWGLSFSGNNLIDIDNGETETFMSIRLVQ